MERQAIFPLNLFLLPGEISYLHIFEPRYKQLLKDVETNDMGFGIFYHCGENKQNLGTFVELKDVINRYPSGEADISIQATKLFNLEWFEEKMDDKPYPGGEVQWRKLGEEQESKACEEIIESYRELLDLRYPEDVTEILTNRFDIAGRLNLSSLDKLKLVQANEPVKQDEILMSHLKLNLSIARQEVHQKHNFNLN